MLKKCGLFCLGSMRMILFFICVICLIGRAGYMIVRLTMNPEKSEVMYDNGGFLRTLSDIIYLTIFSVGSYGTFHNNKEYIKAFAGGITGYTLVASIQIVYLFSNSNITALMKSAFMDMMIAYDWNNNSSRANLFIDEIQQEDQCCGYEGPQDWASSRAWPTDNKHYPRSCCPPGYQDECTREGVFMKGCKPFINSLADMTLITIVLVFASQILITVMAWVVASCRIDQPASDSQIIVRTNRNATGQQPYNGTVYVGQPPHNEGYQGTEKTAPTQERTKYGPAPPSYYA